MRRLSDSHADSLTYLSTSRFHRAAIDGYVDMLCNARKKQTNETDESGLTPTHLAALNGHLDALRILVGRGGNPEKCCTSSGSTALHLAASRNHLNCVSFLVNFGVNIWALDDELHTAKDVAAMHQASDVLEYLDQVIARQSAVNTRSVQKAKEKAKQCYEKRSKFSKKSQLKAIKCVERDERYLSKLSSNRKLLKSAHSISDIQLVGRANFSISSSPSGSSPSTSFNYSSAAVVAANKACRPPTNNGNPLLQRLSASVSSSSASSYCTSLSQPSSSSAISSTSTSAITTTSTTTTSASSSSTQPLKFSELIALDRRGDKSKKLNIARFNFSGAAANDADPKPSVASKLREFSGVSRKVRLRRLLLASLSGSGASFGFGNGSGAVCSGAKSSSDESTRPKQQQPSIEPIQQASRLCNVQPAIKLKLNTAAASAASSVPSVPHQASDRNDKKCIRQACSSPKAKAQTALAPPPNRSATRLSRATSEPDFSALSPDSQDDSEPDSESLNQSDDHDIDHKKGLEPRPPQRRSGLKAAAQHSKLDMLNKCLSQLNVTREAIVGKPPPPPPPPQSPLLDVNNSGISIGPTNVKVGKKTKVFFSNSDELIQHQLSVGNLPLKPSLIKQLNAQFLACSANYHHQHQIQQHQPHRQRASRNTDDSIGSAASLADSQSSSSAASPKSSLADSSADFSAQSAPPLPPPPPRIQPTQQQQQQSPRLQYKDSLDSFLDANNLIDLSDMFAKERIDLEALMLLSDDDLRSIGVLLGPRRKLIRAIGERRQRLERRHCLDASAGLLVGHIMVDTQL